jgi:hypothetical protein
MVPAAWRGGAVAAGLVWLCALPPACGSKGGADKNEPSAAETAKAPKSSGLTRASTRLVCEKLKRELTVELYVTRSMAPKDWVAALERGLERYRAAEVDLGSGTSAKSKLSYRVVDVATDEQIDAAKRAGLQQNVLAEADSAGDSVALRAGFIGVVLRYGSDKEVIPYWPPGAEHEIELFLTSKIYEIYARVEKITTRIGVVTGKGEVSLGDPVAPAQATSIKTIFTEYFPYYRIEDVDLRGGDREIDPELKGILVTQPSKAYSDKELARIDEFLMRGDKAAAFFVSAVNVTAGDATMRASLDLHGLDRLLSGYGVEIEKRVVLDFAKGLKAPALDATGAQEPWFHPCGAHRRRQAGRSDRLHLLQGAAHAVSVCVADRAPP